MKSYIDSFLELLYPEKNTCFICEDYDESINDKYICSHCEKLLIKLEPPLCIKCSKPIDYASSIKLCQECYHEVRHFETAKAPFAYKGLIKEVIYLYKYYNKPYFYKMLGNLLVTYMNRTNYTDFDCIVSVPLHSSKIRKRGYNQSELLAKYISEKLSIPYVDALKRIKRTAKQSEQSRLERMRNLKNAFGTKKSADKVINKTVLLVDDIFTTGSTVDECSKVLLNSGAAKVYVITIAR
jgi:competence protein ComFC